MHATVVSRFGYPAGMKATKPIRPCCLSFANASGMDGLLLLDAMEIRLEGAIIGEVSGGSRSVYQVMRRE
jgi:hypothetical protein